MSNFEFIMDEIETMLDKLKMREEYGVSFEWKNWRFEILAENHQIIIKPMKIQK